MSDAPHQCFHNGRAHPYRTPAKIREKPTVPAQTFAEQMRLLAKANKDRKEAREARLAKRAARKKARREAREAAREERRDRRCHAHAQWLVPRILSRVRRRAARGERTLIFIVQRWALKRKATRVAIAKLLTRMLREEHGLDVSTWQDSLEISW